MYNLLFCALLLTLTLLALIFVIPPLWVSQYNLQTPKARIFYSCILSLFVILSSYVLYRKFGAITEIPKYYSLEQIQTRAALLQIQPLYARLQRELVKNKLDLALDLVNIDLILHFATIHSELQQGVLQPEIIQLLQAVLKAVPQQVTALNLLAINAYKQQQYAAAIKYWEEIAQQFTAEIRNSKVAKILQDKIIMTRDKQKQFESSQTNKKNF